MAVPALASIADFEARLPGSLADSDMARAWAALDDASAWIRAEAGEDWLDDDNVLESVPGAIVAICVAVARMVFDNPGGATPESVDGYSYNRANASSDVFLTASERRMIRRALGRSGLGAITLETPYTVPYWTT